MRRLGWQAKTTYSYDSGAINSQASSAPGHDQSYDASFTARGNLTSVSRWDVTDIENTNKALTSQMSYDAAGNVVTSRDAANHQSLIGYSDSFPGTYGGTNTFAYPTTVTDADGNSSYAQYNYYFGAKTQVQGPPPANQSSGIVQTFTYDEARRVKRATVTNTGAYSHYEYGPNYTQVYSSVNTVSTDPVASDSYSVQLFDGVGRVFAAAGYHPGSGGGYKAQWTQFDAMGRAMKQSNPTEVTGGWAPAGDDVAGVVYTQQTYDWQGRPLETRHLADGTVKYAEYSGCGCAGGEMVTLTDEVGRQQKVYSDVLGRQWKTEVLNWGGTVYSTRMIAYNTRDQITSARQYQGTDQSGIYQEETETYDGYGRLSTRKAPIQTTATTYTYYANDKPQTATDARGAATTYSYNNRGLVTGVSLTGPAPVPGAISYGYDAAGNRTSMSDETGSTTYGYDQLSRLQSETRQFSGTSVPPGTYTLSYEYNLAGELKAITDPTSSRVDYGLDSNGRLTSVIGSGANSAPTYASNFGYRAWGGVKDFDLGSGVHQHMNFNSRLQNTSFALSNVSSIGTMTWSYDYYADSKLSTVTDSADPRFDRFFDYDHEGRIANALTGSEARGVQVADGPFKQSYGYDVWENTISRSHRLWGQATQTESVPYPNNQHQFWGYDNAGNVTYTYDADFHYDAAGRQNSYTSRALVSTQQPMLEVAQKFDGNGAPASKTETKRWEDPSLQQSVETVFYLRSTALGGRLWPNSTAPATNAKATSTRAARRSPNRIFQIRDMAAR